VVARRQLLDAELTAEMLRTRLANRRLIPLHRGVYAVGHRSLTRDGHWLAAVLAAGPGAVLSHREAAALHELRPSSRTSIDVTVAARRSVVGIRVHRVEALHADDVTTVAGIPVTTVARTLVDLAGVVSATALRKALDEAERSRRLDVHAIEAVLARTSHRRGPGHAAMRAALADLTTTRTTITRSPLEDHFLPLLDAHGLPRPLTNHTIHGIEVDAYWPGRHHRLIVELDGWNAHHTTHAFQADRERSNDLTLAGYTVLRFTHADVVHQPQRTAALIARALG
jgi:hypothetical protein